MLTDYVGPVDEPRSWKGGVWTETRKILREQVGEAGTNWKPRLSSSDIRTGSEFIWFGLWFLPIDHPNPIKLNGVDPITSRFIRT